jgi:hypothetical protein
MDARSTMIDKQCQHHLTIAGYGTTLFWSGRWRMFLLLTHAFSLWNIVQTPGLVLFDNTIQKLNSLSFIPQHMFLEDTHASFLLCVVYTLWHPYCRNFPIPQNLCADVMHPLHTDAKKFTDRWSVTLQSHNTIWSTLACGYGPVAWEDNRVMPDPECCSYPLWTSCTSQTLLYAANSCHHTNPSWMNEWMNEW